MRWENPPETSSTVRPGAWKDEAAELRAHPFRWAVLAEFGEDRKARAYDLVTMIRYGRAVAFRPAGSFESVTRRAEDGTQLVYAMFVGAEQEASTGEG